MYLTSWKFSYNQIQSSGDVYNDHKLQLTTFKFKVQQILALRGNQTASA